MHRRTMLATLPAAAYATLRLNPLARLFAAEPESAGIPMRALVDANTRFAWDIYAQLREREGNLFLSPYSISIAIAMTSGGARGETLRQINDTLRFPDHLQQSARQLIDAIQGDGQRPFELHTANSLWGQEGYPFEQPFLELLADAYRSELFAVDFGADPEAARNTINDWVEEQTNDKIQDLIPAQLLSRLTTLVLVNAIYFKAGWRTPFNERATREEPFHLPSGDSIPVPTMHALQTLRHTSKSGFAALELPYKKDELSMLVLVPEAVDGLPALEAKMDASLLKDALESLQRKQVSVALPKFKYDAKFELADTLAAMGMPDAMKLGVADFTGITRRDDVAISNVVHQAYVEVNEVGTEAAAATGVVLGRTAAPRTDVEFRADRPFLFLIREHATGSVLFLGRVTNPVA